MVKPWIYCSVAAVIWWFGSAASQAQPVLHVRAETRIELHLADGHIVGTLVDDVSAGLSRQTLSVVMLGNGARQRAVVLTDANGGFEVELTGSLPLDVEATFDGDPHFQRSTATRRLENIPSTVRFSSEDRSFDLDALSQVISVEVTGPESDSYEVVLGNELGSVLGRSPAASNVTWTLNSPELGPSGSGSLKVLLQDGDERVLAESEIRVIRFRQPTIALERIEGDSAIVALRGRLEDSSGPLRRRALSVFLDNERVETLLSGSEGEFQWDAPLENGPHTLYVRFESDQVGHPFAESETLEIVVGGSWVAELWFLLPFVFFALFALWLRRSQPEPAVAGLEPIVRGVSLRIPAKASRTHEISGRLKDLVDGHSKEGHVRAVPEDGESRTITIAEDGDFSFELPDGQWRLVFGSIGHAPEILDLRVPHDGRFQHMSVRLENWRHRAVRVLRRVAKGVLGRRDLTSTTVHQLRDEPELAEIASDVETFAYGPSDEDGAAIGALEENAARIAPSDDRTR